MLLSVSMQSYPAEQIKARLVELERTQAWLARKVGVSGPHLFRWLTGERPIPSKRLAQIAEVLGVAVGDLTPQETIAA